MAFALIGIGLLLFMAAYHNNVALLGSQISADVTGSRGFIVWVVALFIIGAIGYIPVLKPVSRIFLVLILVVIFLSNQGFVQNFTSAFGIQSGEKDDNGPTPPKEPDAPTAPQTGSGDGQ